VRGLAALKAMDIHYGMKVAGEMVLTADPEEMLDGIELKGRLLLADRQPQEALANLEQARAERHSPLLDCDIANCLALLERREEALRTIESVGRKAPIGDPDVLEEVYARKGQVLALLGRTEDAIANFSKALGLARPGDKRAIHSSMAECYEVLGMKDKAREYSRKALRR